MKRGLWLFLVAAAARAQTPTPRPQCTEPGWYQRVCDSAWQFASVANAGHVIPSGCNAHNLLVADDTGAFITIIGQCGVPCQGFQQVFKKPDHPSAALFYWSYYYTDPDAALHRALFHYEGPGIPPPGLQVLTPYRLIGAVPDPPRAALIAAYDCEDTGPTPTATPTATPSRTPTPGPSIFRDWIYQFVKEGFSAGCSPTLYCPGDPAQTQNGLVTRGQAAVFGLKAEHGPSYVPPRCVPPGQFLDVPCS